MAVSVNGETSGLLTQQNLGSNPSTATYSERQARWNKTWYEKNKEKRKAISKAQREKAKAFIREQKNKPCSDCGETYPFYVMDFHHNGEKEVNIAKAASQGWSIKRLQVEIDKCELLCSNCHRMRHPY